MRIAFVLLLAVLAGCSRGPDVAALEADVRSRLAQALPPGTLEVRALRRLGSQADASAPAGEERRTVYFAADLAVQRDFDFGAWDAPGVAGLVSALGAGPKGVTGILTGGNRAGDALHANGTLVYGRTESGWTALVPDAFKVGPAPAYATNAPEGLAGALETIRKVVEAVPRDAAPAQRAAIEQELAAATAAIRARLARAADGYAIAAGPERGQYLRFAQAFAQGQSPRIVPLVTRGGDENLRLLREGKVALALAQADAARDSYEGKGSFAAEGPYPALRAIGSLYPEPVHVLVRAQAAFRAVGDLKGRRVAIGEPGSAARATALRVLEAHDLRTSDIAAVEVAFTEALVMLQANEVDAAIHVIGVPADSLRDVLAAVPLRLLSLSDAAIARLTGEPGRYLDFSIPAATYPTQERPVRTVATAAVLLAGGMLSESELATITSQLFGTQRDLVALGSAQGAQVSVANARLGLSIPIHAAALKTLDQLAARRKPR